MSYSLEIKALSTFSRKRPSMVILDVGYDNVFSTHEEVVRSIPKMQVNIQDKGLRDFSGSDKLFNCDGHVVEETKAPVTIWASMVPRWTNRREGRLSLASEFRRHQRSARRHSRCSIQILIGLHRIQNGRGVHQEYVIFGRWLPARQQDKTS